MVCVSKYMAEITPVHAVPQSVNEIGIFIQNATEYSDDVCSMLPLDKMLASMNALLQDIARTPSLAT
jgi:hypothetical protein